MAKDDVSPVMRQVSAHFKSLTPRVIEVAEWGAEEGGPLVIYGMPMNVAAAEKIFAAGKSSSFDMFVEAMIRLACDAKGDPLFTIADRPMLRRTGAKEVVERVGLELIKSREGDDLFPSRETRVKN